MADFSSTLTLELHAAAAREQPGDHVQRHRPAVASAIALLWPDRGRAWGRSWRTHLHAHLLERFVAACAHVVATGGIISGEGRAAVEQVASGLLVTPAHARGIIDQTLEEPRADRP